MAADLVKYRIMLNTGVPYKAALLLSDSALYPPAGTASSTGVDTVNYFALLCRGLSETAAKFMSDRAQFGIVLSPGLINNINETLARQLVWAGLEKSAAAHLANARFYA